MVDSKKLAEALPDPDLDDVSGGNNPDPTLDTSGPLPISGADDLAIIPPTNTPVGSPTFSGDKVTLEHDVYTGDSAPKKRDTGGRFGPKAEI